MDLEEIKELIDEDLKEHKGTRKDFWAFKDTDFSNFKKSFKDAEFKNFRDEFRGFRDGVGVVINGPRLSPDLPERVWLKFKKCPFVLVLFSVALSFEVASLKGWQTVYNYLLSP